jgi:hypothetical protein
MMRVGIGQSTVDSLLEVKRVADHHLRLDIAPQRRYPALSRAQAETSAAEWSHRKSTGKGYGMPRRAHAASSCSREMKGLES